MKRKSLLLTTLLAMILLSVATVNTLYPDSTAISVQPPAIVNEALVPGASFSVEIVISDVTNLGGYEFNLTYDTNVLTATKFTVLNGTDDFFAESKVWYSEINDPKGTVIAVVSATVGGVSGTGAVATIDFEVDSIGKTGLNLTDTKLGTWDIPSEPIDHEVHNGYFDNTPVAATAISVEPPAIVNEALVPGDTFSINITISDVENLGGYDFMLNYSTSVLTTSAADVTVVTDWFGPSVHLWKKVVDDTLGYVRLWVTLPLGTVTGVDGSGTVVTIKFTVDDYGTSVLDLNDTFLGEPLGEEISHGTGDGFFINNPVTHDVAVIYVGTNVTAPIHPGQAVNITVVVENQGDFFETFAVAALNETDMAAPAQEVTDLAPRKNKILYFIWDTTGVAGGTYTIKGMADTVTDETDTDDNIKEDGKVTIVHVQVHDIAITSASAYPTTVEAGETVTISVTVKNEGTETETFFKLTVYYDDFAISTLGVMNLPPGVARTLTIPWFTYGVTPSAYTIKAVADKVPNEIDIDDNTYFDGTVTIIPPPIPKISIDPDSGPTGAKVTVNGSNFPPSAGLYLTFDDHLLGFILTDLNGNFTATFSVPLTEAGEHTVKAWTTYYYPYHFYSAEATFTVIDTTPLDVKADVGAIYFKEETAEFYVQTSFKGVPVDATSIHVTLYKPDGTAKTLTAQRTATGLYKIEYSIKGKGSMLGTYTLVVEANYSSTTVNATGTSLKTFIVKSPWREWEQKAPKIALSIVTLAAASALIVIWRREDQKLNL